MIFKSSTYTGIMQNLVEDFLMNTHDQSSLVEYPLFSRKSYNWLYHIRTDCFKPYRDLVSFTQYMLPACELGIEIPPETFISLSKSSDP
jgi:hypothetical protein